MGLRHAELPEIMPSALRGGDHPLNGESAHVHEHAWGWEFQPHPAHRRSPQCGARIFSLEPSTKSSYVLLARTFKSQSSAEHVLRAGLRRPFAQTQLVPYGGALANGTTSCRYAIEAVTGQNAASQHP